MFQLAIIIDIDLEMVIDAPVSIRFQQLVHAIYNSNMWYLRWAFNRSFDWDNQLYSDRWTVDTHMS